MLDPWIIEEIRRREEDRRREREAIQIELPLHYEEERPAAPRENAEEVHRGVVVIDL